MKVTSSSDAKSSQHFSSWDEKNADDQLSVSSALGPSSSLNTGTAVLQAAWPGPLVVFEKFYFFFFFQHFLQQYRRHRIHSFTNTKHTTTLAAAAAASAVVEGKGEVLTSSFQPRSSFVAVLGPFCSIAVWEQWKKSFLLTHVGVKQRVSRLWSEHVVTPTERRQKWEIKGRSSVWSDCDWKAVPLFCFFARNLGD